MHAKKEDLAVTFSHNGAHGRGGHLGDMHVAFEEIPAGFDTTELFRGLPNDSCQSPHWGYLLKGRMRIKYANREKVINAGEAYHLAPGHNVIIEENAELVEFSPKGEYDKSLGVAHSNKK